MACMSNLASSEYPNLLELKATCRGVEVSCMLDSGAMHSFVHPRVVEWISTTLSKGAKLTVMVKVVVHEYVMMCWKLFWFSQCRVTVYDR